MLSRASGSSSLASHAWPRYGYVPLMRCPDCLCVEPLVRLICKKLDTGNFERERERERVKCESRLQAGKILRKCNHFMWMDAYVEKPQLEGFINGGADVVDDSKLTAAMGQGANGQMVKDVLMA